LQTTARREGDEWVINGVKRFNSGMHRASHDLVFARTSGTPGEPLGITAFIVPRDAQGLSVDFYWWTFNMPTDHAEVTLKDVRVGDEAILGELERSTAAARDPRHHMEVTHLVAMANYRANRLACDAADRAMQTCGGMGYTRHMPFEHIYRHHRRYRITEGSEEVQIRKVGYE